MGIPKALLKSPVFWTRIFPLWPPYLGAGIKMTRMTPDWRNVDIEMPMYFWNKNYVGTHYGGSMFSMTDPWYMIMIMNNLGKDYIVWDKAGSIRFKNPGRGTLRAQFRLTQEQIDEVRNMADRGERTEPTFSVQILDESGLLIAETEKTISIRRKDLVKAKQTQENSTN
ncbi:hypothetical protein RvY_13216 [Ramazzottius varieornatus]|uniref:DUF4442 domain-containing protein n=1 Tax=Ramazzottius varieornatus TaxID=947166 RepID=A0A1D1VM39_RAMVA|nr:hypothetical protein RvY_13216 [Ramazzottius varieornatus]